MALRLSNQPQTRFMLSYICRSNFVNRDSFSAYSYVDLVIPSIKWTLFTILAITGCPPTLHSLIQSFHDGMEACVQFDGVCSNYFPNIKKWETGMCVCTNSVRSILLACLQNGEQKLDIKHRCFHFVSR